MNADAAYSGRSGNASGSSVPVSSDDELCSMINLKVHRRDQKALICGGEAWTYGELHRRSIRVARNLAATGLEPGDRIATLLPNSHELVLLYLAAFAGGFTITPLDVRYNAAQINFALRHCGASCLMTHPPRLRELAECDALRDLEHRFVTGSEGRDSIPGYSPFQKLLTTRPSGELNGDLRGDDIGIVFYTSGTTARPKGVTLTRDAIASGISKSNAMLRLTDDDVTLIAAPVSRPMALRSQLLPSLAAGATVVLADHFEPDAYLSALRSDPRPTFLALLPAAMRKVLFHQKLVAEDLAGVRLAICGGDHVPADLFERFHSLTGIEMTEQCGMTETGMYAINPPYGRKKRCSIGLSYYGVQVLIVDGTGNDLPWGQSGEIVIRSPFAMDGYWNDTAATRRVMRDGWIRTGDMGRIDDDGYLWLDGRKKDIIVRNGSNIAPAAVEDVLQKHESVVDACVVGVDDPEHGQTVHAFVTLLSDAPVDETEAAVATLAARELPGYMVPESICALPKMPRTGSGKLDRQRLKWIAESPDDATLAVLLD